MKKLFYPLIIAALMFISGCGDSLYEVYNGLTGPVESVALPKTASIVINTAETLDAKVYPSLTENKNVTWSSVNGTGQITVDQNGRVTGVALGDATVTVTTEDGGKTASCTVTVVPTPIPIETLTLPATLALGTGPGQQKTLTYSYTPSNATNATNSDMTWASSISSIATVDSAGLVTGVSNGTTTITVTSKTWSKSASCTVTVGNPTYTVMYYSNYTGGPAAIDGGSYETGFNFTTLVSSTFTRSDYILTEWNTSASGGGSTYECDSPYSMGTSNFSLYAIWTPKTPSAIVFADGTAVTKVIGNPVYTNTVSGAGDGVITYTSGTPATATVNSSTGTVTILSKGTTVIIASKASTGTYASATNSYTLTVAGIGDAYKGGKIAYILQSGDSGYDVNVPHGLIAAINDQSTGIRWAGVPNPVVTMAAFGEGSTNTDNIVAFNSGSGILLTTYAAGICDNYTNTDTGTGVYSDWYLPSYNELLKLHGNKTQIGGFSNAEYWTSHQSDEFSINAYYADFSITVNPMGYSSKTASTYRVRAVRNF